MLFGTNFLLQGLGALPEGGAANCVSHQVQTSRRFGWKYQAADVCCYAVQGGSIIFGCFHPNGVNAKCLYEAMWGLQRLAQIACEWHNIRNEMRYMSTSCRSPLRRFPYPWKVTNSRHDLENMMEALDTWPRLISEERESWDLAASLYPCKG